MPGSRTRRAGRLTCVVCAKSLDDGRPLSDETIGYKGSGWSMSSSGHMYSNSHLVEGRQVPAPFHAECWVWWQIADARSKLDSLCDLAELAGQAGRPDALTDVQRQISEQASLIAGLESRVEKQES